MSICGPQCRNSVFSIQGNRSHLYSRKAGMGHLSRRGALIVILMCASDKHWVGCCATGSGPERMMGRGTWFSTWLLQDLLKWLWVRVARDGLPGCSRTLLPQQLALTCFHFWMLLRRFCLKQVTTIKNKKAKETPPWTILELCSALEIWARFLNWLHILPWFFPVRYPGSQVSAGATCSSHMPSCFVEAAPLEACSCTFTSIFSFFLFSWSFFLTVSLFEFLRRSLQHLTPLNPGFAKHCGGSSSFLFKPSWIVL